MADKKINYVHPNRPRPVPMPDADGIIRLRKGESISLGRVNG